MTSDIVTIEGDHCYLPVFMTLLIRPGTTVTVGQWYWWPDGDDCYLMAREVTDVEWLLLLWYLFYYSAYSQYSYYSSTEPLLFYSVIWFVNYWLTLTMYYCVTWPVWSPEILIMMMIFGMVVLSWYCNDYIWPMMTHVQYYWPLLLPIVWPVVTQLWRKWRNGQRYCSVPSSPVVTDSVDRYYWRIGKPIYYCDYYCVLGWMIFIQPGGGSLLCGVDWWYVLIIHYYCYYYSAYKHSTVFW